MGGASRRDTTGTLAVNRLLVSCEIFIRVAGRGARDSVYIRHCRRRRAGSSRDSRVAATAHARGQIVSVCADFACQSPYR